MVSYIFLAIAIYFDFDIDQTNIKITFLYGLINHLINVEILKKIKIEKKIRYINCEKLFIVLNNLFNFVINNSWLFFKKS